VNEFSRQHNDCAQQSDNASKKNMMTPQEMQETLTADAECSLTS
jgi:hypothetical protein